MGCGASGGCCNADGWLGMMFTVVVLVVIFIISVFCSNIC